jgi:poly(3-hydroxyalkanoate) depolymerase
MQVKTISRRGCSFRTGIRGATAVDGSAPPLVIFNGLGASLELLAPFVAALVHRSVLVIDAPGVGTRPPSAPYTFASLARQAHDALSELEIGERAIDVMGASWGGCLAQQFALQYPDRCRRLILAATSPGALMVPGHPSALLKVAGALLRPGAARPAHLASSVLGRDFQAHPERYLGHIDRLALSDLLSQGLQILALSGWSSLPWLWRLRQPTLILAGRHDALVPLVNARLLAALIPGASLAILEDGHGFLLTRAGESAALVQDFLSAGGGS